MIRMKERVSGWSTARDLLRVGCSGSLCRNLNMAFSGEDEATEVKAAAMLAGGILQHGYQCGMIWGASLAAGARAHALFGPGAQAEVSAIRASQALVDTFREKHGTINCLDITDIDLNASGMKMFVYFVLKAGTIRCMHASGWYANRALRRISDVLGAPALPAPEPPVSCAAMLAERTGLSPRHRVMAAGFAGGIGLSGGACGALAASVWIKGMQLYRNPGTRVDFADPAVRELIDSFLPVTGYEFECDRIVGRRFESVEDHSAHLQAGGCRAILDALAAGCGV